MLITKDEELKYEIISGEELKNYLALKTGMII